MIKVVFLATSVVEAVNGKTFEEGKAYWLRPDQYAFWDARGRIAPAPADMKTENAPFSVMRVGRNTFDVVGPSNRRLNTAALPWEEAEALRVKSEKDWLAGSVKAKPVDDLAAPPAAPPAAPVVEKPDDPFAGEDPFADEEPATEPAPVRKPEQGTTAGGHRTHSFRAGKRK
jgi:hypothetical protein